VRCGYKGNISQRTSWNPIIEGDITYIPLSQGEWAIIDTEDLSLIRNHTWYYDREYAVGFKSKMHRLIVNAKNGEDVDHKNIIGVDNRKCNLRKATRTQNNGNSRMPITNTSGFKGVSWDAPRQKWKAQISINNKNKYLGRFNTPEEAHEAYSKAAKEYFGEFVRLK
jgi:hypothetical protein